MRKGYIIRNPYNASLIHMVNPRRTCHGDSISVLDLGNRSLVPGTYA